MPRRGYNKSPEKRRSAKRQTNLLVMCWKSLHSRSIRLLFPARQKDWFFCTEPSRITGFDKAGKTHRGTKTASVRETRRGRISLGRDSFGHRRFFASRSGSPGVRRSVG